MIASTSPPLGNANPARNYFSGLVMLAVKEDKRNTRTSCKHPDMQQNHHALTKAKGSHVKSTVEQRMIECRDSKGVLSTHISEANVVICSSFK
jgi:hypothetical protein